MYIKKLILENVGPISNGDIDFPFSDSGNPKPVILVGKNGSGKSIALSYVVNAALSARQAIFEDLEVEKGKVYKYRSPGYIQGGKHHYFAQVIFEEGYEITEWQLSVSRKEFEQSFQFTPVRPSWSSINEEENNFFYSNFHDRKAKIESLLNKNCFLYFPPNRFEEPAWLNYENLVAKASFTDLKHITGYSNRQSIQYAPLKINKDWLMDILFDRNLYDVYIKKIPIQIEGGIQEIPIFAGYQGAASKLYDQILQLIRAILRQGDDLRFGINPRHNRNVALMKGDTLLIPNIFQLSTGESLVLNLGLSILRDWDLCKSTVRSLGEIKGLVVIDEIDLHLHADFQFEVLPELLRLFPKIQFLMTSHSPLFLMGMKKVFGKDGFMILSMPDMKETNPEKFSEFEEAYKIYKESDAYTSDLDSAILKANVPAIFLEGPIDIKYLTHACKLLGEESLLDQITLFDGDGFGNLDKVWKSFKTCLAPALPRIVVLIYDCDTQKSNSDSGNLKKRVIPVIQENPIPKGIENLFSRETLEKARMAKSAFIDITASHTKKVRGQEKTIPEVWEINASEKANLCNWLIQNGNDKDFSHFVKIISIIRESASLEH